MAQPSLVRAESPDDKDRTRVSDALIEVVGPIHNDGVDYDGFGFAVRRLFGGSRLALVAEASVMHLGEREPTGAADERELESGTIGRGSAILKLTIVKRQIREHDGSLTVEHFAELGGGARVGSVGSNRFVGLDFSVGAGLGCYWRDSSGRGFGNFFALHRVVSLADPDKPGTFVSIGFEWIR